MIDLLFVGSLGAFFISMLFWSFRVLPDERWQMLAAVPTERLPGGGWRGLNLTWYGVFQANASVLSSAMLIVLLASIGVPIDATLALVGVVLAICLPAARVVARLVEGKRHTFTVAGAFFVGTLIVPPTVLAINHTLGAHWGFQIPTLAAIAAIAICYTLGEGLGRLACISFGCCYGKPLEDCHPIVRRLLQGRGFIFTGTTKKAAYEAGLQGTRLAPIQALTAIVFTICGLITTLLFLRGWHAAALLTSIGVTQVWRFLSEFLRADDRGGGKISAYQVMALLAVGIAIAIAVLGRGEQVGPTDISAGLRALWTPAALICLQGLWLAVFLFTGRSEVTHSTLSFDVHRDRI